MNQVLNLLQSVFGFWLVRDLAIGGGFALLILMAWRFWKQRRNNSGRFFDDEHGDHQMFEDAIDRGLETWQAAYLRGSTARELHRLVKTANKSARLSQVFGLITLVGSPLSSLVTGAGVSQFGLTPEQLSFWVTSVSSIAGAIAVFLSFDQKAIDSLEAARKIRAEVFQFLGGSLEYSNLPINEAFQLLTDTLEKMLEKIINADAAAAAAKREAAVTASKSDGKQDKDES